jgi:hypothetical protein
VGLSGGAGCRYRRTSWRDTPNRGWRRGALHPPGYVADRINIVGGTARIFVHRDMAALGDRDGLLLAYPWLEPSSSRLVYYGTEKLSDAIGRKGR